ncbi:unnamed protein product [Symbiodinium necroappetens]|uniref:Uncharacterized protein n=1 Tax=Symbiodinium necroappetens TaxID=1628268 RepID=A0A812VEI8_9DINO|nr:unnamed protein product [Symbiodinium necroappetens]
MRSWPGGAQRRPKAKSERHRSPFRATARETVKKEAGRQRRSAGERPRRSRRLSETRIRRRARVRRRRQLKRRCRSSPSPSGRKTRCFLRRRPRLRMPRTGSCGTSGR